MIFLVTMRTAYRLVEPRPRKRSYFSIPGIADEPSTYANDAAQPEAASIDGTKSKAGAQHFCASLHELLPVWAEKECM